MDTANEAKMHDTRSLIDTRRYQTNKSDIDSNYRMPQYSLENDHSKMNNNENNARFLRTDGQSPHHWGADDEIMAIVIKIDKSPKTAELGRRRMELARPGAMGPHWNKNLGRGSYIPRRPEKDGRREIKRIDIQLRRKVEESHIGGGYFQSFGDEIPQTQATEQQQQTERNELP